MPAWQPTCQPEAGAGGEVWRFNRKNAVYLYSISGYTRISCLIRVNEKTAMDIHHMKLNPSGNKITLIRTFFLAAIMIAALPALSTRHYE